MTVVSSKEFISNQEKFFDLALNERVFIKQGDNMFIFTNVNIEDDNDDENDYADYLEAKARENDEKTSADEFLQFLRDLRK